MERISKENIRHVAELARLELKEEEIAHFGEQLDKIILAAEELNELNTDNVEATSHVVDVRNVMRRDEVKESLSREDALKNAPDEDEGQVRVPSVLD
ncbi:Asp-tRNA(Asn)/Glu-tRNA(Gln) amidotransferase subunit GatC [Alkalicoccus urumqiensis]|uniref:Aspartyl/glutamyl-tRNA(Asn/Gln) amidotransferase subunit C n=1 Tax=Alkalicoccus urumqiensis TaxID=1548213 RepID=A0A2P6MIX8_ALKUR|nr:Asp-tRNA(Asn)/Glu-tRNA(Gln) amidotransferase subunit GatC [Alkalicoccus urumqiensis]PRO66226.1 Asp-tRNA(Asn)/Glu-tRNA(Gln) amidotransferase GatCAB subunit C [Alkalicoccus urumqiensis]